VLSTNIRIQFLASLRDKMMLRMQGKKGLYTERCKVLGIQRGKKN
jgi:hypothetical protein